MIKNRIQECYDKIRPGESRKDKMLDRILAGARVPVRRKRWLPWAATMPALAAAVLVIVLFAGKNNFQAAASVAPSATTAVMQTPAALAAPTSPADGIVCRVMMSINPKVEFQIGADGMIVNVVGLNDDGIELIKGIDFAGLSMENATIIVVNRLIEKNYITASMVNDVYITVSGTPQPDTLAMMSNIIKTAASQYNLSVDTVQTQENELQVVVEEADAPEVTDSPEVTAEPEDTSSPKVTTSPEGTPTPEVTEPVPAVDPETLPVVLTLKYIPDSKKTVGNIYVYPKDGKEITNLVDFAGMYVNEATLHCVLTLREKGYLPDSMTDGRVLFDLSKFNGDIASQTKELLELFIQEECLPYNIVKTGQKELSVVPSAAPASERSSKYGMSEIRDVTLNKSRDDITELQMKILSLVYDEKQIEELLKPRYWVVLPDLMGLFEEKAMELCELSGLEPLIHYTSEGDGADGTVVYQDIKAGQLWEVSTRWDISIKAENAPLVYYTKDDIPSEIRQYLPTFLDDPGGTVIKIEKGGNGEPFRLGKDWEVKLYAYGGGVAGEKGSDVSWKYIYTNNPDKVVAYWDPEYGNGDGVPQRAALVYYVYKDGKILASVAIQLELIKDVRAGYGGKVLKYRASLAGFGEGREYSFDGLIR